MNRYDTDIFQHIAALLQGAPWVLPLAKGWAAGGGYAAAALVGWSVLRAPRQRCFVLWTLMLAGLATLVAHDLAARLGMPRPFVAGFSPMYLGHRPSGSLPSAHATVLMLIALRYVQRAPLRGFGAGLAALAVLTCVARIVVGVHFPQDIVAGYGLALAIAATAWGAQAGIDRLRAARGTSPETRRDATR